MNKTVNINLAGIFFHIDEDAYLKLQRYLDAIKHSFTDSQGRDEIIADIEARVAELFSEKIQNERQVIGIKEVDDVISIMGQPEDYHVDEEIFEDEPRTYQNTTTRKQLFRDTTNSYVGGVSSGLGHYLGLDAIWLRIAWVLFTIFSGGAVLLIYLALWIFVPEAKSTADFLAMKGEQVNISNIEKKIKEGFNDVADKVKDVDYKKYSDRVKKNSTTFFDSLGNVFGTIFKAFGKLLGIVLMIISGITLIGLFVGLFIGGFFGFMETPATEHIEVINHIGIPIWLGSLLAFIAVGIPFFFLFIVSLKIVLNNLKSIGTPAKLTLFIIWLVSIVGWIIIGIKQETFEAYDVQVLEEQELAIGTTDTLRIKMNDPYKLRGWKSRDDFEIKRDENDNKILVFQDLQIYLKENEDSNQTQLVIKKIAKGNSYKAAKARAEALEYDYKLTNNTLFLSRYAITDFKNKYFDQEIDIILYVPKGLTLIADQSTEDYNSRWSRGKFLSIHDLEEEYLTIKNSELICTSCQETIEENDKNDEDDGKIDIDIESDDEKAKLKINENGVRIKSEEVDIKIDQNGVKIKTEGI